MAEPSEGPLWTHLKSQLYKPEVKLIKRLVGHQLIQQNRLMWDEIASLRQMWAEFKEQIHGRQMYGRRWKDGQHEMEYQLLAEEEHRRNAMARKNEISTAELKQFLHRLQEIAVSPSLRTVALTRRAEPRDTEAPEPLSAPRLGSANVRRLQALITMRRQTGALHTVEDGRGEKILVLKRLLCHRLSGLRFFEVFFSQMPPRTKSSEHSEPQNYILTLHLGLQLEQGKCSLQVGRRKREWEEGQVVVFDTTYIHAAANDSERSGCAVLVLRFWHPGLSKEDERCPVPFRLERRCTWDESDT
eukprot:g18240.t1